MMKTGSSIPWHGEPKQVSNWIIPKRWSFTWTDSHPWKENIRIEKEMNHGKRKSYG
jgi:hypothetical protein